MNTKYFFLAFFLISLVFVFYLYGCYALAVIKATSRATKEENARVLFQWSVFLLMFSAVVEPVFQVAELFFQVKNTALCCGLTALLLLVALLLISPQLWQGFFTKHVPLHHTYAAWIWVFSIYLLFQNAEILLKSLEY